MSRLTEGKKLTSKELTIIGGKIKKDEVDKMIKIIPIISQMPFAICEYTNQIKFTKNEDIKTEHLERGRLFGENGDLEIRRDEDSYLWRFIGAVEAKYFLEFSYNNFWNNADIKHLYEYDKSFLLWGERKKDNLHHDIKVASAKLIYPVEYPKEKIEENLNNKVERAIVKYRLYTSYGRPQFAWYYGVEGKKWRA